ncbi:hypothetical protein ACF1G5_42030 [Streptomyces coeruleorubidus]|uniref:hypothetical protein n=1 Tax=Streptomyces coeruleorubidus TaxID=116188 RepID=UPI0036FB4683
MAVPADRFPRRPTAANGSTFVAASQDVRVLRGRVVPRKHVATQRTTKYPGERTVDLSYLQAFRRFLIRQKVTPIGNRYVVAVAEPDGSEGKVVAFAEQELIALKEQVTFYTDESQQRVLFTFNARQVIDLGAEHDVMDDAGAPIGLFRKDFRASLLRSTWHLEQPHERELTGRERNWFVAVLRRLWDFIPSVDFMPFAWPYHFDFTADGLPVMSVDKKLGLRDRYVLDIQDPGLDRRLAIAQAVALDMLQER